MGLSLKKLNLVCTLWRMNYFYLLHLHPFFLKLLQIKQLQCKILSNFQKLCVLPVLASQNNRVWSLRGSYGVWVSFVVFYGTAGWWWRSLAWPSRYPSLTPLWGSWLPVWKPVSGLGKNEPHKKQHKLTVKEHKRRLAGIEWWRLVEAGWGKAPTGLRRSDSASPIIHAAMSHSRGIMGFFRIFFSLSSLTLSETDSYLHWLTLRELGACWERGVPG